MEAFTATWTSIGYHLRENLSANWGVLVTQFQQKTTESRYFSQLRIRYYIYVYGGRVTELRDYLNEARKLDKRFILLMKEEQ